VTDRGDVNRQRARRSGDIPPGQDDAGFFRHPREPVEEAVDVGDGEPVRKDQGEQGQARSGAHRRDVADVDRQRLVAHVGERGEPQVEVDALHQDVGGQDVQLSPDALSDGGVVSDADLKGSGRRGKAVANPLNQAPLADRFEQRGPAVTGRSQWPASRGSP
jgi:hypothetical protein